MPKRILLADDSITIQKVVELTFSDGDYEVTAVNNGSKAVAKLAEMRPDIILSDIIMPEKNGYEVCEFVKSHPEYRNIPVVLLTGTFEPFDPDRAEKAGCDAVVTKPFESQSLIHKVEELIAQAQSSAAAAPAATPQPETPSPWMEEAPAAPPPASPFSSATSAIPALSPDAFGHGADIFGAAPSQEPETAMPLESPAAESPFAPPAGDQFSGETRGADNMAFGGLSVPAEDAAPAPAEAPSPWDESPKAFGDPRPSSPFDTPAPTFEPPAASFDSFASPAEPEVDSPFGAPPPAEDFSGETRAFPRMSFDEMQAASTTADTPAAPASPAPETSPWEQESPAFGGETRAFEKMSFGDLQQQAASASASDNPPSASWSEPEAPAFSSEPPAFNDETPAFGEPPAFNEEPPAFSAEPPAFSPEPSVFAPEPSFEGETRAFQKMSFDDLQQQAQPEEASAPEASAREPEPEPTPWSQEPEPVESLWASPESPAEAPAGLTDEPSVESEAAPAPFTDEADSFAASPSPEDLPFATDTTSHAEPENAWGASSAAAAGAAEANAEAEEPVVPPAALAPDAPPMSIAARGDLSDDQVDRIARRVIELMSDQVVRNIAWEVIPDVAEMIVKERIRQLESEA